MCLNVGPERRVNIDYHDAFSIVALNGFPFIETKRFYKNKPCGIDRLRIISYKFMGCGGGILLKHSVKALARRLLGYYGRVAVTALSCAEDFGIGRKLFAVASRFFDAGKHL